MNDRIRELLRDRRFHRLAGVAVVVFFGLALWLWRSGWTVADVVWWLKAGRDFLAGRPVWLFVALVILPGFPVPASALFFLAGVVWGKQPVAACGYGLAALVLNQAWTYALAAGPAHNFMGRVLGLCGWRIPVLKSENVTDTMLVMRLVPGIPLFVQNYLLGLLRVPYGRYAWISLVCNGPPVIGVILAGAGISDGRWKTAVVGIAVLVLAIVVVRVVRRKCRVVGEGGKS